MEGWQSKPTPLKLGAPMSKEEMEQALYIDPALLDLTAQIRVEPDDLVGYIVCSD